VRLSGEKTGRRWRRPARECPWWCAGGHQCTAQHGYPSGEHRSTPEAWTTTYGRLVATRVETIDGRGRLELRGVVRLPVDEADAHEQAARLAIEVDLTIRAVRGDDLRPPYAEVSA
jgi:hypothetical protein